MWLKLNSICNGQHWIGIAENSHYSTSLLRLRAEFLEFFATIDYRNFPMIHAESFAAYVPPFISTLTENMSYTFPWHGNQMSRFMWPSSVKSLSAPIHLFSLYRFFLFFFFFYSFSFIEVCVCALLLSFFCYRFENHVNQKKPPFACATLESDKRAIN